LATKPLPDIPPGAPDEDTHAEFRIDFVLRPGSSVSGTVIDAATTEGIADVGVQLIEEKGEGLFAAIASGFDQPIESTTADDGAYTIENVKPGQYRVRVRAREHGYIASSKPRTLLNIDEGVQYDGVDFALERGAVVEGVVKTTDGAPVTDAFVGVRPGQIMDRVFGNENFITQLEEIGELGGEVDEQGRFTIAGLDFDTDYRLHAKVEEYADTISDPFRIAKGGPPAQVTLIATRGSTVSGTVRFDDGALAAGHELMLFPNLGDLMSGVFTEPEKREADENGRFEFTGVAAGKYSLMDANRMPNFMPFAKKSDDQIDVETDGIHDVTGLVLVLAKAQAEEAREPATGVIEGVVLQQAGGGPVASVRVAAENSDDSSISAGAFTRDDGTFKLERLRGDFFDLSVVCDKGVGFANRVSVGTTATIRLGPPTKVSGQVLDEHGRPVPECKVQLTAQRNPDEDPGLDVTSFMEELTGAAGGGQSTDDYGFFEFENPDPGDYTITAKSKTAGTGEHGPITVHAGRSLTGLEIRLTPGVRFSGSVVNTAGRPVPGATVSLRAYDKDSFAGMASQFLPETMQKKEGSALSDENGAFEILNVAPAVYTVRATHPEYAGTNYNDVEVEPRRDMDNFKIVILQGGRVQGQALTDGVPQPNLMAQMVGENGMQMATTDADGRFDIQHVTPGKYIVQLVDINAMMSGGTAMPRQRPADVIDGETTVVDFSPPPGSVPVNGTITGDLGNMTFVMLRKEGGIAPEDLDPFDMAAQIEQMDFLGGNTMVGPDGSFSLEGVQPGDYILEVMTMDFDMTNPDLNTMANMDRTPVIRQNITIEAGNPPDLQLTIPPHE
ncbi:MAG: hypothetical protein GWP08_08625, partial [Nitrospiraceae bacterium]|nr:hypothetical protein [Nitrospiraceae bacterium]